MPLIYTENPPKKNQVHLFDHSREWSCLKNTSIQIWAEQWDEQAQCREVVKGTYGWVKKRSSLYPV